MAVTTKITMAQLSLLPLFDHPTYLIRLAMLFLYRIYLINIHTTMYYSSTFTLSEYWVQRILDVYRAISSYVGDVDHLVCCRVKGGSEMGSYISSDRDAR